MNSDNTTKDPKVNYVNWKSLDPTKIAFAAPEAKTAPPKKVGEKPTPYRSAVVNYNYGDETNMLADDLNIEGPELVCPFGASFNTKDGKTNWYLRIWINENNPSDMEFYDWFRNNLYQPTANYCQTVCKGMGVPLFDSNNPEATGMSFAINRPKNKDTQEEIMGKGFNLYLNFLNGAQKTVFVKPTRRGEKLEPVEWSMVEGARMCVIPVFRFTSIYGGAKKMSPQFKLVSAVIKGAPKSSQVPNAEIAYQLAEKNPELANQIDEQLKQNLIEKQNRQDAEGKDYDGPVAPRSMGIPAITHANDGAAFNHVVDRNAGPTSQGLAEFYKNGNPGVSAFENSGSQTPSSYTQNTPSYDTRTPVTQTPSSYSQNTPSYDTRTPSYDPRDAQRTPTAYSFEQRTPSNQGYTQVTPSNDARLPPGRPQLQSFN